MFRIFSGESDIREVAASGYPIDDIPSSFLLGSIMPQGGVGGGEPAGLDMPLAVTQDSALIALQNPAGTLPLGNQAGNIVIYTVEKGDTPSGIAKRFGITLNTLLWANDIKNSSSIGIGDELVILPISGIQYTVKKGDTLESIAKKFKGDSAEIMSFNGLAVNETLEAGAVLIIPDGEGENPLPSPGAVRPQTRFSNLPVYQGYYLRPIVGGRKTQGIHGYNGVDLASSCGEPVFASASGSVILARPTGWNSGYGQYTVLSHSNSTQTLYAHLSKIFVSPGQNVSQGAIIGLIGSTGRSTGCHVHFEVRGARNPF
ncbi:MAG: hypothetical protein A2131_02620 [Candidatus Sungbacteria bacterium GWC2_49_10]|uniref:LysM domain-containing protein n=1 Tax=Candidatus Sungbacteria bacterium GWC2_49_10 TaxID=1802263 RepID=A0A1G2K7Y1_9BACT|nr:MAG: hypothetical protein A2131_02620 [Candidatus Sungbacteria bacterium GWC2_49_10]